MSVPRLPVAMPNLNESDTPLQQPPRNQQLPGLRPRTIKIPDRLRFFGDVEGIRRIHLHSISQFKRLDAGLHLGILRTLPGMLLFQLMQQIKLLPLLTPRKGSVFDMLDELVY